MLWLAGTVAATAGPLGVVAVGGSVVVGQDPTAPEATQSSGSVPGGWVPVLADCLEERATGRFTVVDRSSVSETIASARARAEALRELGPAWVVVTLGAHEVGGEEPSVEAALAEIEAFLTDLRGKARKPKLGVLVVGLVPPSLAKGPEQTERQAEIDGRTEAWNTALTALIDKANRTTMVDLWTDWPRQPDARSALTEASWHLSDPGHARVAAAVCDSLVQAN